MTNSGVFNWDGKIYCRHGGFNHTSWWVLSRKIPISLELDQALNEAVVMGDLDVCIYVQEKHLI